VSLHVTSLLVIKFTGCSPDPAILEDVQRIIRAKARHDARARSLQSSPQPNPVSYATGLMSGLDGSARSSPISFPSSTGTKAPSTGDVDFSPSVGDTFALHPVPVSSNDGATLDWSGYDAMEERHDRKWSISVAKRKGKHKPTTPAAFVEQQDSLYTGRSFLVKGTIMALALRDFR
jgi:hypothetical protein